MVLFTLLLVAQPFEEVAAIHVTPPDLCTCPLVLWSTPREPTAAAVSGLKGVFSTLHISVIVINVLEDFDHGSRKANSE